MISRSDIRRLDDEQLSALVRDIAARGFMMDAVVVDAEFDDVDLRSRDVRELLSLCLCVQEDARRVVRECRLRLPATSNSR